MPLSKHKPRIPFKPMRRRISSAPDPTVHYDDPHQQQTPSTADDAFCLGDSKQLSPLTFHPNSPHTSPGAPYKLYKRRFVGLLILASLNAISSLHSAIFSTITTETAKIFQTSLTRVNWLGNVFCVTFVFVAWFVPFLVERFAIRWVCIASGTLMTIGSWIRFISVYTITSHSHSDLGGYPLLLVGSLIISISQPLLLILGPAFSELYFSPSTRLTATMIISVSNPIGQALAQLLAPAFVTQPATLTDFRILFLLLACATSLVALAGMGIGNRPPTPPSAISQLPRHSPLDGFRVLLGLKVPSPHCKEPSSPFQGNISRLGSKRATSHHENSVSSPTHFEQTPPLADLSLEPFTLRDRIDFFLLTLLFGTLLGAFMASSILIEQIYSPYGYNSSQSGFFGVACVLSGLLSTGISAPIFARYFPRSNGTIIKILGPLIGVAYFGLIWIAKSRNLAAIYVFNIAIGVFSFICLPVALELGADITYTVMTPDSAAAILYLVGNAFSVTFLVVMDALRAGPDSSPPFDMNKALVFQGAVAFTACVSIVGLKAKQYRPDC